MTALTFCIHVRVDSPRSNAVPLPCTANNGEQRRTTANKTPEHVNPPPPYEGRQTQVQHVDGGVLLEGGCGCVVGLAAAKEHLQACGLRRRVHVRGWLEVGYRASL